MYSLHSAVLAELPLELGRTTLEEWALRMADRNPKTATGEKARNPHFQAISDLELSELLAILDRGGELKRDRSTSSRFSGFVLGLFFFQGSTRTRVGFHAAAARLGITALTVGAMRYEPQMSKPEDPLDAFRSVASYCDLIVLRHSAEQEFLEMVKNSPTPVINGGSGVRHHPTQTVIDLFCVRASLGSLAGLRWGIAGDLASSRTARSLIESLKYLEISELRLMCPAERQVPPTELSELPPTRVRHCDHLSVAGLDVLYMAGYPEGSGKHRATLQDRSRFRLTRERARKLSQSALILNPLPRIDEIDREVDDLPQAMYFKQSRDGLFIRMAILEQVLLGLAGPRTKDPHRSA